MMELRAPCCSTSIAVIFFLLLVEPTTATEKSAIAEAGQIVGKCLMQVDGKTYIDGPCYFVADTESPGGFAIEALDQKLPWSAYVGQEGGSWNNDEGYPANRQHDTFGGPMWREGACWVNERAKVCAWK